MGMYLLINSLKMVDTLWAGGDLVN